MSYLLDTDWIIQALTGNSIAASIIQRLGPRHLSVSWIAVAEVYEGAFTSVNPQAHLMDVRHFLGPFRILNLNDAIVERFAETRAFLRRRGEMISDFDVMIAATALHYDLTVLTYNLRHFQRIPDLKLYQSV